MSKQRILPLVVLAGLIAGPAVAQNADYAGTWACQFSYTELTPQGGRASGFTREFMIAIYPDGGFEAQGTEAGMSGYSQFQAQGRLEGGPQGIFGQGQMMSNDPYALPGMMFAFGAAMQPDGRLSMNYEQPDPNNQYVMNRTLTDCQRAS